MAKLTIEIEENEFALYDVRAYLDGEEVLLTGNYTSEEAALAEAYEYLRSGVLQ
jgi:hypothetical protein